MSDLPRYVCIDRDYRQDIVEIGGIFNFFSSTPNSRVVELEVDICTAWEGAAYVLCNPPFSTLNLQILKP